MRAENVPFQQDTRLLAHGSALDALQALDDDAIHGSELVGLLGRENQRFALNPTGLLLWEMLEESRTVSELVQVLEDLFTGVDGDELERAVNAFVDELLKEDLAEVVE